MGLIPDWGTKLLHAVWCVRKKKKKEGSEGGLEKTDGS